MDQFSFRTQFRSALPILFLIIAFISFLISYRFLKEKKEELPVMAICHTQPEFPFGNYLPLSKYIYTHAGDNMQMISQDGDTTLLPKRVFFHCFIDERIGVHSNEYQGKANTVLIILGKDTILENQKVNLLGFTTDSVAISTDKDSIFYLRYRLFDSLFTIVPRKRD